MFNCIFIVLLKFNFSSKSSNAKEHIKCERDNKSIPSILDTSVPYLYHDMSPT